MTASVVSCCPPHRFVYPMPDGREYVTGVCSSCGEEKVGRNWEPEIAFTFAHRQASQNGGASTRKKLSRGQQRFGQQPIGDRHVPDFVTDPRGTAL